MAEQVGQPASGLPFFTPYLRGLKNWLYESPVHSLTALLSEKMSAFGWLA